MSSHPRLLLVELSEKEAIEVRNAIAFAVRNDTSMSKAKKQRLVDVAEHKILREMLKP